MITRVQELDESGLSREAEIHAMRFMGDQLSRMAMNMDHMASKMAEMHTDVALMKQSTADHKLLWEEVTALKMRAAQQDGAFTFAKAIKDFGPWIVAIAAAAWALLHR